MKQKKKSPFEKYKNWIGMGLVLFVFVVVLLAVGKPKSSQSKSTATTKKTKTTETERIAKEPRAKKKDSAERLAARAQKKLERERKREERREAKTTGGTTAGSGERASRQTRSGTRTSTETSYILKGIFVDENGQRYALIGDRRTRNGDVVAGRKIEQVEPDRVSVEYGGSTYEVKIGNSLY
jgi:hypothetical protein